MKIAPPEMKGWLRPCIHAYVKKAEKIGKVMTRRVANKQIKQDP